MESLFRSLRIEQVNGCRHRPPEKAKADAFDHIKTYGNPVRRHSGPNYRSPWEFEKRMAA